ncbi:hypothetical protein HHK36_027595 [Tetracentron sinense]|uniref:Dirigent protein n=1 Tax=Tetracentron sinense TaxID=13715 RepID=A0A834YDC2_TETSI|nr:hypothetical protein HHK36_027595 [Tetracentron sinense]
MPRKKIKQYEPCKHLVLFFHDIIYDFKNAENVTSAIVGAPEGANRTILAGQNHFGDVVVFDDPITLDNNLHSKPIGRAQGLYIYNLKNAFSACLALTFVLNSTDYQGTINFIGADPILAKTRDISLYQDWHVPTIFGGSHWGWTTLGTYQIQKSLEDHNLWSLECLREVVGHAKEEAIIPSIRTSHGCRNVADHCFLLPTSVGAGFVGSFEFKKLLRDFKDSLEALGVPGVEESKTNGEKFFARGNIAAGVLFLVINLGSNVVEKKLKQNYSEAPTATTIQTIRSDLNIIMRFFLSLLGYYTQTQ